MKEPRIGSVVRCETPTGSIVGDVIAIPEDGSFYVRGHFLRTPQGHATAVSKPVWLYSFVHSISIWPTIGIVLGSMLILSKPHIIATMQEDSIIRGQSFVTAALTIIAC